LSVGILCCALHFIRSFIRLTIKNAPLSREADVVGISKKELQSFIKYLHFPNFSSFFSLSHTQNFLSVPFENFITMSVTDWENASACLTLCLPL